MKQAILTLLQLALTAGGGTITGDGIATEGEVQTIIGAIITIAGVLLTIWMRRREAAKVVPALLIFCLLPSAFCLSGCNLTPAQKETVSNALIEIAKAGLKIGLSAIAKNNPDLAKFVPNLEARFQVTFSNAATQAPEDFAKAIRDDVLATVADADTQKLILTLLAGAIREEAKAEGKRETAEVASASSAPPRENQVTYALQVADRLQSAL